jgi:sugar phosphate isomerase/epimerase
LATQYGVPVRKLLYSMPRERWPNGGLTSASDRDRVHEQVEAALHIASTLGLETIGLWPGADGPTSDRDTCVTRVSDLSVLAHRAGVRIAIEPKPGTLTASADDVGELRERAARREFIGVLLDTGHEHAAGNDPARIATALGARLLHVHLGDSDGDPDADLPPGRLHPVAPFLEALDTIRYEGAMSPDAYGAVAAKTVSGIEALNETVRQIALHRARTSRQHDDVGPPAGAIAP